MGIFPDSYGSRNTTTTSVTTSTAPDLLKEYAINFDTGQIAVDENGKFTIVTRIDAIEVRCWLALDIQRNRFIIYPSGIGNNLKSLLGKGISYTNKNIQSLLDEALVDNVYILSVTNISVVQTDSTGTITFTVNSIYGSTTQTATY